LSKKQEAPAAGMYYDTKTGWQSSPWDLASRDVAFIFYAYHPNVGQVQVACGGFSARGTKCLTQAIREGITGGLGEPQYLSDALHVGVYLVEFLFDPKDRNFSRDYDARPFESRIIRLDEEVLEKRLRPNSGRRKSARD